MTVVVGTLPAEHSVDANGSFTLRIPIKVPPANFPPTISFSYHSAASDFSLGPGWMLKGEVSIQRNK